MADTTTIIQNVLLLRQPRSLLCLKLRLHNFRCLLLAKQLHSLIIHRSGSLTSALELLRRTLVVHILPEVAVYTCLVRICKAILLLEVAVAEVVAVTGVEDW